jgi:hypothetical protein
MAGAWCPRRGPLWETIRVIGLGRGLSATLERCRAPRAVHDPGKIITCPGASVAAGGDCLADIAVPREHRYLNFSGTGHLPGNLTRTSSESEQLTPRHRASPPGKTNRASPERAGALASVPDVVSISQALILTDGSRTAFR